jgi:crotonobetainyl-CoA:carnitine CoA-transferase CaiB-like acyl-CoA transferase
MAAPLAGIRVVELASFVAAPSAGALLVDLGADVIKVEVPWGEIYRHSTPRLAGYDSDFGGSAPFQMDNHGKRSLAIDLALPPARDALARVIDGADVLLTNMLPGRLAKYGFDPDTLRAARPELIVARLSGYGADGPEADTPAFDYTAYWARTGLMDQLRDVDAPPAFQRPGIGDHSAGLALALGIVAALRTRDADGRGQVIDVALQNIGYCKDERWLSLVMIESDRYWPQLARAIGRPELVEDERFAGAVPRYHNSSALVELLEAAFAEETLEEWTRRLQPHRLIWAPVHTLAEAIHDPTAVARGVFPAVDHPELGRFRTVAPPLSMSGHPMPGNAPGPTLGADTEAVLSEAGVDEETIALLVGAAS